MITFRTIRKSLAPRWLTEGAGELVGYALDVIKDAFIERTRLGLLSRFPQQDAVGTPGANDALIAMGRDRRVVRGIDETDTVYASRLKDWLTDRRRTGNPFALMKQLAAYTSTTAGLSFATVDVRGNWYLRDSAGVESSILNTGVWDWDGDSSRWSRFWVIIYPSALWAIEGTWGSGSWGDTTGTWGSTATPEHATTLRSIVADWKPGGTNGNIILALDPASFDTSAPEPDGLWGKWYKYSGGTAVASRLSTARYFGA